MRSVIVFIAVCLFVGVSFSQNQPRYAQLNFAQGIYNPAALSIDAKYQVDLMFRNQWFQFEGAPTTFAANAQYELATDMAVGLNFYHDRIGVTQNNAVSGQYAYRLLFEQSNALIFGVGLGIESKTSDFASTTTTISGDPAFAQSVSKIFFNSSVGAYYYSPKFYIGASIPQMFQTNFGEDDGFNMSAFHYYFSTGWYFHSGRNYTFNPNIQVKAVRGTPIQGDLVLRNTFYGRWSIVVGYRTEHSIIAGLDFLITPFMRAGYSFNHDVGQLARVKGMSNEIHLGFGMPYRSDRGDFGNRKYINKKGGFQRQYKRRHRRKYNMR
jgi:type IX secretion system PorP/SprF family membrane protein